MVNTAICDDCAAHNDTILKFCNAVCGETGIDINTEVFTSGEALIARYKSGGKFDVIFLDIDMGAGNLSGIDTAKLLRDRYDRNFHVVFLTSYPEYIHKSFYVYASNYLMKPLTFEAFKEELLRILDIMNLSCGAVNNSYLVRTVPFAGDTVKDYVLNLDKVLYFQTNKRSNRKSETTVVTDEFTNPLIITKAITKITADLKNRGFYVIMRATLVNLSRINSFIVNTNTLTMDNGDILSYSKGTLKTLKTEYNKAKLLKW